MGMARLALRYVAEREQRGDLTHDTARGIRYRLLDFAEHAPDRPRAVRRKHVERWMADTRLAASTRKLRLSALRGFCAWLLEHRHIDRDPTAGVKAPKTPQRQPRNLHADESPRLVMHAPDSRARFMILLQLQEGLRCVELERAQVGDIDRGRAVMAVRGKGSGGHVSRSVPLSVETLAALDDYLAEHPAPAGPLIRSYQNPGRSLTARYISALMSTWMTEAGIKRAPRDGKSAHACRHTCATDMVDAGADVLAVQRALGHASITSTQVYLRGVTPELRAAMGGRSYTKPRRKGAAA
jgi:integrase/recombinase XerC